MEAGGRGQVLFMIAARTQTQMALREQRLSRVHSEDTNASQWGPELTDFKLKSLTASSVDNPLLLSRLALDARFLTRQSGKSGT